MSNPYMSQITMVGFNWAPKDWSQCDGQSMAIAQHQALYSLLGNRFGGDGRTTFSLPDLRGRTPVGPGTINYFSGQYTVTAGQSAGQENVTLTSATMPAHRHVMHGSTTEGTQLSGADGVLADAKPKGATVDEFTYGTAANMTELDPSLIGNTGEGHAHSNLQPSLVVNFCMALTGTYPSRN